MHEMCVAALRGRRGARRSRSTTACSALHKHLFVESNPIPVKWALHRMGRIAEGIRLPLTPLAAAVPRHLAARASRAGCLT